MDHSFTDVQPRLVIPSVIAHPGQHDLPDRFPVGYRVEVFTRPLASRFNTRACPEIDLSRMTHAQKNALILSLLPPVQQRQDGFADIAVRKAEIAELTRPPKTQDHTFTPPSKAQRSDRSVQRAQRRSRPGLARAP